MLILHNTSRGLHEIWWREAAAGLMVASWLLTGLSAAHGAFCLQRGMFCNFVLLVI